MFCGVVGGLVMYICDVVVVVVFAAVAVAAHQQILHAQSIAVLVPVQLVSPIQSVQQYSIILAGGPAE